MSWRAATIALAALALAGLCAAGLASVSSSDGPVIAGHEHGGAGQGNGDPTHDHGGAASAVAVTGAQQARADALISSTTQALAAYADVSAAENAGYRWIGDGTTVGQYRHYVQPQYLLDSDVLDPAHVESLVYRTQADGSLQLVSGMYILPPGDTRADVPDVGGDLTPWHIHTNLCWSRDGTIAGTNDSGSCPAGSFNAPTPPMLHVWIVDNPDGRFAAIDENGEVSATHVP
ncbi:MAG: rane protein of unknown function [Rhodoglobus sp.]|nr:rane protein of unknown function [Rhodoglobus sp.]